MNSSKKFHLFPQTKYLSHKTKYAVFFRFLTQTIEAPKKRNRTVRVTNISKKKWKRTIVSKTEKSCSSPMWIKQSMSITPQLIPIYNTIVQTNKEFCCPSCAYCSCHMLKRQHATRADQIRPI